MDMLCALGPSGTLFSIHALAGWLDGLALDLWLLRQSLFFLSFFSSAISVHSDRIHQSDFMGHPS
jgi:hypothetical protein